MAKINAPSKQVDLNKQFKSPLLGSPSKLAASSSSNVGKKSAKINLNLIKKKTTLEEDPIEPYPSQYDLTAVDDDAYTVVQSPNKLRGTSSKYQGPGIDIDSPGSESEDGFAGGSKKKAKSKSGVTKPIKKVSDLYSGISCGTS